jgi:hypothetical protein
MTQPRGKSATSPSGTTLRLVPYLLLLLGLSLGGYPSYQAYLRYSEVRDEVGVLQAEADRLRGEAAVVNRLRAEVARLESSLAAIRWPEAPEAGGAVWLAGELAEGGWRLKNVSVGKGEDEGGLTETPVTVSAEKVSYGDFVRSLEGVKERRVRLRGLKLSADGKGDLAGELVFGFLRPTEPLAVPAEGGERP